MHITYVSIFIYAAIGYEVISLHRTSFCGITLSGLSPDNWKELSAKELKIVSNALERVSTQRKLDET